MNNRITKLSALVGLTVLIGIIAAITPNTITVEAQESSLWNVGIRGFVVGFAEPFDAESIERLATEVRPRLEQLVRVAA